MIMGKFRLHILALLMMLVLLSSCNSHQPQEAIRVESDMTIACRDLYPINGKNQTLSLKLVEGSYSEDWLPGPFMGRNWKGKFQLILADEHGQEISRLNLNEHFQEELVFNDLFEIQFDDYNGDQAIDFTIGQYGTSNWNVYRLFTITGDHQIQELKVDRNQELFISGGDRYSIKLEKVDSTSFRTTHYDNAEGKETEITYTWDGEKFIQT